MIEPMAVRRALASDLPEIARLAGELVRQHHTTDPNRFFLPENVVEGYTWWFSRELARPEAVILVAGQGATLEGYAYGALGERDWNLLLDEHGAIHDIYVVSTARRHGVGRMLVTTLVTALEDLGAPRIVLSTMVQNEAAQGLFRSCGFRSTMLEMTR